MFTFLRDAMAALRHSPASLIHNALGEQGAPVPPSINLSTLSMRVLLALTYWLVRRSKLGGK